MLVSFISILGGEHSFLLKLEQVALKIFVFYIFKGTQSFFGGLFHGHRK